MELNKILDFAIMADETKNTHIKAGYTTKTKTYHNYLSNDCFNAFIEDMKLNNKTAWEMYGNGGGKELEERTSGTNVYPPKMASFGSSSRMIYNLMKNTNGFLFEKKLPTTVGGIANLDGFMETPDKYVFVEAKCREPYTAKEKTIERKYENLYEAITASDKTSLLCEITHINNKKMEVKFFSGKTEILHFDIKQMISHLLGVATAFLNGTFTNKAIDFIYLLYNPTHIEINNEKDKIHDIYKQTCDECDCIDFKNLFTVITEYLQQVKDIGKDKDAKTIINSFSFRLCDQTDIKI